MASSRAPAPLPSPSADARLARVRARCAGRPALGRVGTLIVVLAGAAMMVARRPTALTDPALWAEDGIIFLRQDLDLGWRALGEPYNGYLHLAPRLLARLAGCLPFAWLPLGYALAAGSLAVAVCALALSGRLAWLAPSRCRRAALFVGLVALPDIAEFHLTLTNVIWWCGVALLFVILADDPATRLGKAAELLLTAGLVLSGANGLVLGPFALARRWRTGSAHAARLIAVWAAAAAVQLAVLVHSPRQLAGEGGIGPAAAARAVWQTIAPFFAPRAVVELAGTLDQLPILVLVAVAATVAAAVIAVGHRASTTLSVAGAAAACLVAALAALTALGPMPGRLPERYLAVPAAAFLVALVTARPAAPGWRAAHGVLLAWLALVRAADMRLPARAHVDWTATAHCVARCETSCLAVANPLGPDGEIVWSVPIDGRRVGRGCGAGGAGGGRSGRGSSSRAPRSPTSAGRSS